MRRRFLRDVTGLGLAGLIGPGWVWTQQESKALPRVA